MIRTRVDARITLWQGFYTTTRGNMFKLVSPQFVDRTVGRVVFPDLSCALAIRPRPERGPLALSLTFPVSHSAPRHPHGFPRLSEENPDRARL